MAFFSSASLAKLSTCHPDLVRLFLKVIEDYDCIILEGHRGEADQNLAFNTGKSKLEWPKGNHNATPSNAVDVVPLPLDWNNKEAFYHFGGYVLATAKSLGIKIRWGGDWNGDKNLKNQSFNDLPHFELLK